MTSYTSYEQYIQQSLHKLAEILYLAKYKHHIIIVVLSKYDVMTLIMCYYFLYCYLLPVCMYKNIAVLGISSVVPLYPTCM